MALTVAHFCTE